MIVVERNRIELDHCTNCGGIWFDSGELDLLLAGFGLHDTLGFLGDVLRGGAARTSEKARRCPVCSQRMHKANIGEQPKILIDACPRGDGIWFDGGELDQLLAEVSKKTMAGPEGHRRISDFLGDMFRARPQGQKN
jgi:Zn-finger nucleic acid-binding protein